MKNVIFDKVTLTVSMFSVQKWFLIYTIIDEEQFSFVNTKYKENKENKWYGSYL